MAVLPFFPMHSRKSVLLFSLLAVISCPWTAEALDHADNYRTGDEGATSLTKTAHGVNSRKRFGWIRIRPLWMDIEKTCFARTCVAPFAVQLISIEAAINHTAMFYMDIDDPAPPVDMYFPTPPSRLSPKSDSELVSTANFSVGLFGVDPTYRFPRQCHSMIENSVTFSLSFETVGRQKRPRLIPPPSILSFGADCLNLTFHIGVMTASYWDSNGKDDVEETDNPNFLGAASTVDKSFGISTPVPMWIVAILAGANATLLFAVVALAWRVSLSAKKNKAKRHRHQRSSASSGVITTTNSYVPSCTTRSNRRFTPPLPPPPLRPPPSRSITDHDQHEPKYDVPWTDNGKFERYGDSDSCKIKFHTLQKEPQFFNYYFSADDQQIQSPVSGSGEINCNDRPKHLRRIAPSSATMLR